MPIDRRSWLTTFGLGALSAATPSARAQEPACPTGDAPLRLQDFRPRSHAARAGDARPHPALPGHRRAHAPHVHHERRQGRPGRREGDSFTGTGKDALEVMDRKGVKGVVNLTGGTARASRRRSTASTARTPGASGAAPSRPTSAWLDPRYPQIQADADREGGQAPVRGGSRSSRPWASTCASGSPRGRSSRSTIRGSTRCGRRAPRTGCPSSSTSPTPRPSSCRSTAPTSGTTSSASTPTGRSTARTSRAHADLMAARDRVLARHPKTLVRGAARRARRREPRVRLGVARPLPQLQRRDGCADRRARAAAADLAPLLREAPGPHLLRNRRNTAPVRRATRRSRSSRTSSTRSTTASSRPRTSTSTTRPRRCRRRGAGGSTASACRTRS